MVFDQGRRPTRQEMLRIYEEGQDLAKEVVASLRDRFRKDKRLEAPPKALPPGEPMLAEPAEREAETAQPRSDSGTRD
ncbi:MAG: hypothetical protein K0Q72_4534, partial [Armatimonadetes bacterium]|nr:hypothetical protein [Armatimonadota bacterium]